MVSSKSSLIPIKKNALNSVNITKRGHFNGSMDSKISGTVERVMFNYGNALIRGSWDGRSNLWEQRKCESVKAISHYNPHLHMSMSFVIALERSPCMNFTQPPTHDNNWLTIGLNGPNQDHDNGPKGCGGVYLFLFYYKEY